MEATRLLVDRAANLIETGQDAQVEDAFAKKAAAEMATPAIAACMQAMGAAGLRAEHPLGRHLVAARIAAYVDGTFVDPAARGLGVSRAVMQTVEPAARTDGVQTLFLETGVKSFEALGPYRGLGFVECDPFGAYGPDPLSVFMAKGLT